MCEMGGSLEDPVSGMVQAFSSWELLGWIVGILVVILFINLNGMILTKHVSCVFSAFWNASRCVSVWVVCVILGLEQLEWKSALLQIVGFCLLVAGNVTYNEIVE